MWSDIMRLMKADLNLFKYYSDEITDIVISKG